MRLDDAHEDRRARLILLGLPQMGPSRARWLIGDGGAAAAVDRLRRGRLTPDLGPAPPRLTTSLVDRWVAEVRGVDVDGILARHRRLGIGILGPNDRHWPFAAEPDPPLLVFYLGDIEHLHNPVVAVVGTRQCTTIGRNVAYEIGRGLADRGVPVASGLALGVDGAAHRGVLDSGGVPIGVVATGLDVVYPGAHRSLWSSVVEHGVLLGESPAGTKPARWRFPARNRLIASLAAGVVVVESHQHGGSLSTADEAIERDRPVFAVPGSVVSPASDGTNGLLVEGAIPARHATDIAETLGVGDGPVGRDGAVDEGQAGRPSVATPEDPIAAVILSEVATGPVHIDRLVVASAEPIAVVLDTVQRLVATNRLVLDGSTVFLAGHRESP